MDVKLTPREVEVYTLAATTPWKADRIAANLAVSISTVKSHLLNIFIKLGVSSREELIINYYKNLINQKFTLKEDERNKNVNYIDKLARSSGNQ